MIKEDRNKKEKKRKQFHQIFVHSILLARRSLKEVSNPKSENVAPKNRASSTERVFRLHCYRSISLYYLHLYNRTYKS